MTSITWTAAPAGSLGLGGSDVRAFGRVVSNSVFDMVATAGAPVGFRPTFAQAVPAEKQPRIAPTYIAPNDDTTLGIPSSRRPTS